MQLFLRDWIKFQSLLLEECLTEASSLLVLSKSKSHSTLLYLSFLSFFLSFFLSLIIILLTLLIFMFLTS